MMQPPRDKEYLPYSRQEVDESDIAEVVRVLRGELLTTGPEVERFEKALATYCGARYAVACANGTAGLHLAVMALGLGREDRVLTTPITFLATANCARFEGAAVSFADVERDTANLDPEAVENLLQDGEGLSALLPVHFGGHPASMEKLAELAARHGFAIIEDGCHALGAAYTTSAGEQIRIGSCRHSVMTVFSFHPVKAITTGEGGAITTNDGSLYHRLRLLRSHGMVRNGEGDFLHPEAAIDRHNEPQPWYYEMQRLGYNYRLSDFQCALGRHQLAKLDGFITLKAELAAHYRECLAESSILSGVVKPLALREGVTHGHHLFVAKIDFRRAGLERGTLMRRLHQEGIGTQVHYIPLHLQPYYRQHTGLGPGTLPVAEAYYEQCLSLPLFPGMGPMDVERVVSTMEKIIGQGAEP